MPSATAATAQNCTTSAEENAGNMKWQIGHLSASCTVDFV
ncbi:hypothetical protein HMPREF0658_1495 [Hoylesella marshii DSM 16973 = JCM 13450]|uniref:Uncharacterized protein n=1 Tax=Hoylesella marshii DSM 16973 = JCM 13450 TaxID=862515 RepID=E0NTJ3_9BACT|nr:hypothetical protein HMPREF0658_1495 [Hoylesella marshii DSM 16973 = JCM 13450]